MFFTPDCVSSFRLHQECGKKMIQHWSSRSVRTQVAVLILLHFKSKVAGTRVGCKAMSLLRFCTTLSSFSFMFRSIMWSMPFGYGTEGGSDHLITIVQHCCVHHPHPEDVYEAMFQLRLFTLFRFSGFDGTENVSGQGLCEVVHASLGLVRTVWVPLKKQTSGSPSGMEVLPMMSF